MISGARCNSSLSLNVSKSILKSPSRGKSKSRSRSKGKGAANQGFPTTPRALEKQKKMLQSKLKRLMEGNLRLQATNKTLQQQNRHHLDCAVVSNTLLHRESYLSIVTSI